MKTVNIHEAKSTLSRLLEEVERGERVIIARNGTPIAELTAIRLPTAAERMAAFRKDFGFKLDGLTIRDLIEEGRRL